MAHLKNFTLFVATPDQILEHRKRTYARWGKGHYTLEEYLSVFEALEHQEHSADGRSKTWVLAPRDDPETLDFPCACRSYRRDGIFYDGELQRVTCYNVGFVYTHDDQRRKGYAAHMMRLLHWVIADERFMEAFPEEWGAPPQRVPAAGRGYFSSLYSALGPEFYAKCGDTPSTKGWLPKDSRSTVWELESSAKSASEPASGWKWLDDKEVGEVWDEDVPLIEKDVVELGKQLRKPIASFLPNKGVAASDRLLYSPPHRPFSMKSYGIRSTTGELSYATWTVNLASKPLGLILTRLRVYNAAQFRELMSAVLWYAKQNGFPSVETWNLASHLEDAAQEMAGVTSVREGNLPALKSYAVDDVEWAFNERFGWA
ncbi:hypothetical protein GGG16DRAFT_97455 [Schizophyllum commune]